MVGIVMERHPSSCGWSPEIVGILDVSMVRLWITLFFEETGGVCTLTGQLY